MKRWFWIHTYIHTNQDRETAPGRNIRHLISTRKGGIESGVQILLTINIQNCVHECMLYTRIYSIFSVISLTIN